MSHNTEFLDDFAAILKISPAHLAAYINIPQEKLQAWRDGSSIDFEAIFEAIDRSSLSRAEVVEILKGKNLTASMNFRMLDSIPLIQELVVDIRASQNVLFRMLSRLLASAENRHEDDVVAEFQSLHQERLAEMKGDIQAEQFWNEIVRRLEEDPKDETSARR